MDSTNERNFNDFIRQFLSVARNINYSPILPKINEIIRTSISDNFQRGGRYGKDNIFGGGSQKWKTSKRAISQGGQTLLDSAQMASSIRVKSTFQNGKIKITIGSNKTYAAHQNWGSKAGGFKHPGGTKYVIRKTKGVTKAKFVSNKYAAAHPDKIRGVTKPHRIKLPARPFLVIQNRDLTDIVNLIINHFAKKFK